MEVAESSRQTEWEKPSFVGQLFLGNLALDLIHPFPDQSAEDKANRRRVSGPLHTLSFGKCRCRRDRPLRYLSRIAFPGTSNDLGAWGMKIPREYGGLGFSQTNYNRAIALSHLVRFYRCVALRSPIHRRSAAAEDVRNSRAEEEVPAAMRGGCDFGICSDGAGCRLGSRQNADDGHAHC